MPVTVQRAILNNEEKNYDFYGCDYYDERSLKYLFTISGDSDDCKVINSSKLSELKHKYGVDLNDFMLNKCTDTAIETDLFFGSTCITFRSNPYIFADMFRRSTTGKKILEKTGYILYNSHTKTIFFEEIHVPATKDSAHDPYKAGDYYKGSKVLANIHTHPEEHIYLSEKWPSGRPKYTDKDINDAQYTRDSKGLEGDGLSAISRKTARYTIGKFNVDFFSPYGRNSGVNNLAMTPELNNGSFNILKHALEVYGGKRK